jgi:diadenosine tetraphosphate (Ap4A) HIT family hydrolase
MTKNLEIDEEQILYEDALLYVELLKESVVLGQIKITPKKEIRFLEKLNDEEIAHFFNVSSFCATAVFEGLGAHGTNIIVSSGFNDKFEINIFPRFNEDEINFMWEMKQADPNELEKIKNTLDSHTSFIGVPKSEQKEVHKIEEKNEEEEDFEEDYRIKALDRIP